MKAQVEHKRPSKCQKRPSKCQKRPSKCVTMKAQVEHEIYLLLEEQIHNECSRGVEKSFNNLDLQVRASS